MASTTPYPPAYAHTSTALDPSVALSNLSTYLTASESTPWLHPDARLTSDEIKYSTTGGPTGGIVLHNLRRIQKGLAGEVLAPDPDDLFALPAGDDSRFDEIAAGAGAGRRKGGLKRKVETEQDGEWQDMQQYQLQQEELVGEVGERGAENVGETELMDVDGAEEQGLSKRDKEARKEEKKKRRKAERREKEEGKTKD